MKIKESCYKKMHLVIFILQWINDKKGERKEERKGGMDEAKEEMGLERIEEDVGEECNEETLHV